MKTSLAFALLLLAAGPALAQGQVPPPVKLIWTNPDPAISAAEQVTGYLLKHASSSDPTVTPGNVSNALSSVTLSNYLLIPVTNYAPPTSLVLTNLAWGPHVFTLEASNAIQTPALPSNRAFFYQNWSLLAPVNATVTNIVFGQMNASAVTLTFQLAPPVTSTNAPAP